jgi:hypothetical protein
MTIRSSTGQAHVVVPEPGSVLLVAAGLFGILVTARHRREDDLEAIGPTGSERRGR